MTGYFLDTNHLRAAIRADELTFLEHLLNEHPKAAYTEEVEKRLTALRSEKLEEQKRKGSSNELAAPSTTTTKPATNVPAKP